MGQEAIIHALNFQEFLPGNVTVGGERKGHGGIPRNYNTHPRGCYPWAKAVDFPLIPQSEWSERIKRKIAEKSQISDLRRVGMPDGTPIPSRDQDGKGYCWAHSSTSAAMVLRMLNNDPYADLSAFAVACIIKNYADEGGWGAQSLDWIIANGIPTSQFWPQQSMSRANDNPAMRANAALHKFTGAWLDLAAAQYDRTLSFAQVGTLLLSDGPVVTDYNWWSHSVCAIDLVEGSGFWGVLRMGSGKLATLQEFERVWDVDGTAAGFGVRIWNSWGDSWSDEGMGVLAGQHAIPDGAVAPNVILPSAA